MKKIEYLLLAFLCSGCMVAKWAYLTPTPKPPEGYTPYKVVIRYDDDRVEKLIINYGTIKDNTDFYLKNGCIELYDKDGTITRCHVKKATRTLLYPRQ